MRRSAFAAVLAVAAVAAPAAAGVVLRVSPRELADTAHLVVEGRVLSVKARWDADRTAIETWVDLAVDRVHKGPPGLATALVKVHGGRVGDDEVRVDGMARFEEGEDVFVFLWRDGRGDYQVLGEAQGRFRVFRDGKSGVRTVENSLAGLCLVVRGGAKGLGDARLRRPDRLPYDDLAAIVRDSVAGLPKDPVRDRVPGTVVENDSPTTADPAAPAPVPPREEPVVPNPGPAESPTVDAPASPAGDGDPAAEGDAPAALPPATAAVGAVLAVRDDGSLLLRAEAGFASLPVGTRLEVVSGEAADLRARVRITASAEGEIRATVLERPEGAPPVAVGDRLRRAPEPPTPAK